MQKRQGFVRALLSSGANLSSLGAANGTVKSGRTLRLSGNDKYIGQIGERYVAGLDCDGQLDTLNNSRLTSPSASRFRVFGHMARSHALMTTYMHHVHPYGVGHGSPIVRLATLNTQARVPKKVTNKPQACQNFC